MSDATRTPTPWEHGELDDTAVSIFANGDDTFVGEVSCEDVPHAEMAANAEFIVRAVNAHADLLAACELALEYWYSDHPNDTGDAMDAREKIRAAVLKARS